MDRLIQMIINMVMRRGIDMAMNKGADLMVGRGKSPEEMTPEERMQAKQGRQAAKRMKQAMKIGRRF
ncbi:MAG: hypothetical protein CFE34_08920 [Rhodobacteraceae bacterium PARR1]|nr:MAG: hypothetical protein CFE34_08920 [Rhodobacteraceae bacterium PARR1]